MKVLIVDDEPLARLGLRREVERLPGLTVVGECTTLDDAVTQIVSTQPDVALLDIQLGRSTAFEIIERVGVDAMPVVIFVTAYHRHALRAFEVHALDYLLKPVDPVRLEEALGRAAQRAAPGDAARRADRLEALLKGAHDDLNGERETPGRHEPVERLVVRDGERLVFVDAARIEWAEALGNYVRLHIGGSAHTIRTTMDRLHRNLGAGRFLRIRR